jgi:leader peptidase (prepilin peptidase)/N-methyltransferase
MGGAALLERAPPLCQSAAVIGAVVFAFGTIVGSFLNVCILRIPAGESIVHPRSRCPKCEKPIAGYDNIPVLSWLLLGGKCRGCKTPISRQYPAVEMLTGGLFLACYLAFGPRAEAFDGTALGAWLVVVKWAAFSALVVVLTITDLRERLLPDKVNLTGAVMGLAFALAVPVGDGTALLLARRWFAFPPPAPALSFADALLGAAAGYGFLWIVSEGYFRLRGREGMGLGDVKMMGMVGTFAGLKGTLLTILVGALLGSLIGTAFMLVRRKDSDYELPFGTFLGVAALLVVFFGGRALGWYFARLR